MGARAREFSVSMRTGVSNQEAVQEFREALGRHGFEILLEYPVDCEPERKARLRWDQAVPGWRRYTIRVKWLPTDAFPTQLSDRNGRWFVPLGLCVASDGSSACAYAINRCGPLSALHRPIGIGLVVRGRTGWICRVLVEFAKQKEPFGYCEMEMNEAHNL